MSLERYEELRSVLLGEMRAKYPDVAVGSGLLDPITGHRTTVRPAAVWVGCVEADFYAWMPIDGSDEDLALLCQKIREGVKDTG